MHKSKGIRILDKIDNHVSVNLPDILDEVHNGNQLHWSILDFEGCGHLGEGRSIPVFMDQILKSEKGYFINWDELNNLSKKIEQIYDITLLGCYDKRSLVRYKEDQEMYETCDIVIVMFDSSYWEVFSKDSKLIKRLTTKFKSTKLLETNFQK